MGTLTVHLTRGPLVGPRPPALAHPSFSSASLPHLHTMRKAHPSLHDQAVHTPASSPWARGAAMGGKMTLRMRTARHRGGGLGHLGRAFGGLECSEHSLEGSPVALLARPLWGLWTSHLEGRDMVKEESKCQVSPRMPQQKGSCVIPLSM